MKAAKLKTILGSLGVVLALHSQSGWTAQGPVATIGAGKVEGVEQGGVLAFKGIRYGADTATTRFAAPRKPAAWDGIAPAREYGASCPQTPIGSGGGLFASWRPTPVPPFSEDCLFLNVWTPALADGAKRPVMVWFHGGGFSQGDGSSTAYEGTRLASRGDVVVVTVNHRLNVFGYLALNDYGDSYRDSSVAGILDLIQSLEWVRDNIEQFGGDPDNVMIFGESGGGAKVSTLMASEAAKGLFHRAVVQSGAMLRFPEQDAARAAADQVVANLGLDEDSIDDIRSLPAEAIVSAYKDTGAATAPTFDGRILTRHPFEPDAAPSGRDVPMMLGSNRTESSIFLGATNPALFDLSWEGLEKALTATYPDKDAAAIIAGYRELEPEAEPADIYFEATTDARWLAGHVRQAEQKVKQGGAPVYLYLFNWDTPVDGGKWRSPHALEIGFVFDNVANSEAMSGVGEEQQAVADIMADTWIAFARSGNPNNPHLPQWQPYNLEERPVMVFDTEPQVVNDARRAQRDLLNDGEGYGNRYQR
ncbi:carboxylesterase/lipase family protein [Parahaliea aestuarii]|uniref:Carboxylic ester hydrolase n=1 Tax=Parahaliea aestuarii TaxID=1852021 RepID=A0A5C9A1E8_9GAMM|nr:carboxylesterase/lipase family protein [Parahaliea aestuarii]TXS94685.1 carboxylesterase/lipase family protein [Parahaliea aestuarii]